MTPRPVAFLAIFSILVAGCSSNAPGLTPAAEPSPTPNAGPIGKYIKHVVIIIQENRTFDNIFEGFPGADTKAAGKDSHGKMVTLKAIPFVENFDQDMIHNFSNAITAWVRGKLVKLDLTPFDDGEPAGTWPFSYLERGEVAPYWTMALQYVVADHMFPMEFGPSFTSHLGLVAGTDNLNDDNDLAEANYPFTEPWGCDVEFPTATTTVNEKRVLAFDGPGPCFTQFRTLADVLDAARVSWRYYAPNVAYGNGGQLWSTFDAIKKVRYGPDWKFVLSPQTRILDDARHGKLASMVWVVPDWLDSDHPAANSDTGPSWVSSVVNAIGEGPDWNSTAIFLVWDDWGGWYDNAPPPQRDFRGNGIRVPLVIVSPYARSHYVDRGVYETGSLLRFVEDAFGLKTIGTVAQGYTDARALAPIEAFDFTQKPRKFVPISAKYPASYFVHRKPSLHPVDTE